MKIISDANRPATILRGKLENEIKHIRVRYWNVLGFGVLPRLTSKR